MLGQPSRWTYRVLVSGCQELLGYSRWLLGCVFFVVVVLGGLECLVSTNGTVYGKLQVYELI